MRIKGTYSEITYISPDSIIFMRENTQNQKFELFDKSGEIFEIIDSIEYEKVKKSFKFDVEFNNFTWKICAKKADIICYKFDGIDGHRIKVRNYFFYASEAETLDLIKKLEENNE